MDPLPRVLIPIGIAILLCLVPTFSVVFGYRIKSWKNESTVA